MFNQGHVEIFTAKEGVAIGRFHFKHAIADFEHGDIKCAAAQIINGNGLPVIFVQAISQRSGGRFIDDTQNFKTGNFAGIFGCLTLRIVEIGRHGNHRLGHAFAQIILCRLFHFLQNKSRYLRRRVFFAGRLDPSIAAIRGNNLKRHHFLVFFGRRIVKTTADKALNGKQRVQRIGHGLAFGGLPGQALALFRKADHGRRGARAFGIFNHPCAGPVHDGDTAIGGAQINPDNFAHNITP